MSFYKLLEPKLNNSNLNIIYIKSYSKDYYS